MEDIQGDVCSKIGLLYVDVTCDDINGLMSKQIGLDLLLMQWKGFSKPKSGTHSTLKSEYGLLWRLFVFKITSVKVRDKLIEREGDKCIIDMVWW